MVSYSSDLARKVKIVSLLQMVTAAMLMMTGLVCITVYHSYVHFVAYGIWGGIFFFVTGFLGYLSAIGENKNCSLCYVATFMSLSILDAIMTAGMAAAYGTQVFLDDDDAGATVFLTVLNLLEFILFISSSICCCTALCCGRHESQAVAVGSQTSQVMYIQQGQAPVVLPAHAAVPPDVYSSCATAGGAPPIVVQPGWHQAPDPRYSGSVTYGDVKL